MMTETTNNETLQILLVEDNLTDVLLMEEALEEAQLVTVTLTHAKRLDEALSCLDAGSFDAVLLDLGLPDSQGLETFTLMQERHPAVPILVLSGLDDETLALTAVQDGAQDYLVKGKINSSMLSRTIRYAIERKRTTETIAGSELGYRRLFEAAQDGIFILDAGTGQITEANPYLEQLLGYSIDEFISKRLWEISPFRNELASQAAFRTLQEKSHIRYDDLPLATKDGRQVNVEFVSNIYGVGDRQVIQCNLRDNTERKLAEDALRASETQFRHLMEVLPAGAYTCDAEGRITYFNDDAVRIWGRTPRLNEIADRFCGSYKLYAADGTPIMHDQCWMALALKNNEGYNGREIIIERPDGTRITALAHANPMPAGPDGKQGALNVLVDITERKRAEEASALLSTIVEYSEDAIISKSLDGIITTWNAGAQSLFGYSAEEVIGRPISLLIPCNRKEEIPQLLAKIQSGEPVRHFETVRVRKDGVHLDISLSLSPLKNAAGNIIGVSSIKRDITERKRAEGALRRMRDELEVRVQERTAELEQANSSLQIEISERKGAEAEVRTRARQQEAVAELGHRALTDIDMDTLLAGATALVAATLSVEVSAVLEVIPGEDTLRIRAGTGWETDVIGQIVPGKSASQAGYALQTNAPTVALDLRTETRFTPSPLLLEKGIVSSVTVIVGGYKKPFGTLGAHTVRQRHFTQDDVLFLQAMSNVLTAAIERRRIESETCQLNAQLTESNEQLSIENTERQRALGALQEITGVLQQANTEAEQAKANAEAANLAKSEFLSRMSHELRTPLNAILGFGQILEMCNKDFSTQQQDNIQQILKSGHHLLELINEVLDIASIEAGHLSLSPEPVAVSRMVQEVFDVVRPLATGRNIQMVDETRGRCGEQQVLADQQRLKQVLLNLLSNAVKYNHDGGSITVSCKLVSDEPNVYEGINCVGRLRISVRDTGPGIAPADITRLFTPFERLGAASTQVEGTGIGLSLCERLVRAMKGQIGVESELDQGSTFWLELPLMPAPLADSSPYAAGVFGDDLVPLPVSLMFDSPRTILYIEDNLSNIHLIERALPLLSDQIILLPAMQGRLGLELAVEHQPDMILLDVNLPDIMGDVVLGRLKANALTRDIPVVMLSADATPRQIERLLSAGAAHYLTKPLDMEQFFGVLQETLKDTNSANNHTICNLPSKIPVF